MLSYRHSVSFLISPLRSFKLSLFLGCKRETDSSNQKSKQKVETKAGKLKVPPQYRTRGNVLSDIHSRPVCANLDQKPARQFDTRDVREASTTADGHSVGGPGSGEVQPEEK